MKFQNQAPPPWIINELRFTTSHAADKWVMFSGMPNNAIVPHDGSTRVNVVSFVAPLKSVDDLLTDEELCCLDQLKNHLEAHASYYWRAIWLTEKAEDRAKRLEDWSLRGSPLLDLVENTIYDFSDGYAVMPAVPGAEALLAQAFRVEGLTQSPIFNEYIEQIITTPARGVFAEAKLGHCNASEIIDPTRFWDWQTSPIPDDAPAIAPTSTDSRFQDTTDQLAPTPFPQSIVNIANPQSLPDPAGMNAAASVMSALGAFRDMSGIKELGTFLQTLSNNATQLASQGMKNAQTAGLINTIRSAKEIPDDKRADLISALLTGQVKSSAEPKSTQPSSTAEAPSGSATPSKPTPAPTPPVTPSPDPAPKPKPVPAPTPQRSPSLSSKSRRLTFVFSYDTNDIMFGRWKVTLISGGKIFPDNKDGKEKSENRMINTVENVSGVDMGNRLEMYVEDSFGRDDEVQIQISGAIVGLPQSLVAGERSYEVRSWSSESHFDTTISKTDFAKTNTFHVVQPTEPIEFKISRSVQDTKAETKISGSSGNIEVGVENAVEVGGSVGVAEGKEAVKIHAKGSYGVHSESQNLVQGTNGYTEEVTFKGHTLKGSPNIAPVI